MINAVNILYFRTMPKKRKSSEEYDEKTVSGREKISLLRNRGADRVVETIKKYQQSSQHKVTFCISLILNFREKMILYHTIQIGS